MTMLPYIALWRKELYAGVGGQNPDVIATWRRDGLWRAANLQHHAEETERMLRECLETNAHPDTIRHFLDQLEAECKACDEEFLGGLMAQEDSDAA